MRLEIPAFQMDRLYLRWAIGKEVKETVRETRLPEWRVRLAYLFFEEKGLPRFTERFDLPWKNWRRSKQKTWSEIKPHELAKLVEEMQKEIRKAASIAYREANGDWKLMVRMLNKKAPHWLKASRTQAIVTKDVIGRFFPKGWRLTEVAIYLGWEPAVVNIKGKAHRALRLPKNEFLKRYIGNDFSKKTDFFV